MKLGDPVSVCVLLTWMRYKPPRRGRFRAPLTPTHTLAIGLGIVQK